MKRLVLAAALVVSGSLVAQVASAAVQPLNMTVAFAPNPPRQGTETLTVLLTDRAHEPVNGAHVTVATSMPTMSMSGAVVEAVAKGDGRYVSKVTIAFATRWAFDVTAKVNALEVHRTLTRDIPADD